MLAKVETAAVVGLKAVPITVEVDVTDGGLPAVAIVGLPDLAVKESKERIKSAICNSQFAWPGTRVTVNLAPADVRKEGSAFDLPIALGLLSASRQLGEEVFSDTVILGELALDGSLRHIPGVLPVALSLQGKGKRLFLPEANAAEAAWVKTVPVYPLKHLNQAVAFLKQQERIAPFKKGTDSGIAVRAYGIDFSEVKGQLLAKRAIEVAVAGGHNLLMMGPPGSGKSMLAQRIPTIMPPMSREEALETTVVYSVAGLLPPDQPIVAQRPFRAPHHSISEAGLIGGGTIPKPGELSLAHCGILFLDEMPEFSRNALESLRQPLEDGVVTVARAQGAFTFPARVMVIASMNPCPCGFAGDLKKECLCSRLQIQRYRMKISGPLLDRIDLHLDVPAVSFGELTDEIQAENSAQIRQRIEASRARQRQRFKGEVGILTNAQMRQRHLKAWCRLPPAGRDLLKQALVRLGLSARAYVRILKVARTIADLAGSEEIQSEHLAEAIQYRTLDRFNST